MNVNVLKIILITVTSFTILSCTPENRNSSIGKEDSVHGRTHNGNVVQDTTPAPADNTSNVEADSITKIPQP